MRPAWLIILHVCILLLGGSVYGSAQTISGTVHKAGSGERLPWVAVWVEPLDSHPPFSPPAEPAVMEQRHIAFVPPLLPILVGTRVLFPNHDTVYHNIYSLSRPKQFNLGLYKPGEEKSVVFDKPGVIKVFCNIHDSMQAIILVLETPYFTVTDPQGNYTLSGFPPGTYLLRTWHKTLRGSPRRVEIGKGQKQRIDLLLSDQEQ
ncbi:MAG: methylamine utilization protein [Nitrospinota bacterium]|nr:MAG: methylamine utilization protein [Nitrospinota bacterium]